MIRNNISMTIKNLKEMNKDTEGYVNKLLNTKFFTVSCCFSKGQLKASDDQRCLLQAMMLLDRNYVTGFVLRDFSETSIMEYAESIKGNYTAKQSNLLHSVVQYLTDAFPQKNKQLKKISIPMLLYLADIAEDAEIRPLYFRQWWEHFTEEDEQFGVYKTFCSSGSTKLEKVNGRLAIMVKSFCNYNEIEIPEELTDLVAEVEEKLASKEENPVDTDDTQADSKESEINSEEQSAMESEEDSTVQEETDISEDEEVPTEQEEIAGNNR